MLCSLCSRLDWRQILRRDSHIDHHKTYADLSLAANQGCEFCFVAQIAVSLTYSQRIGLRFEDVVQHHLERDRNESQRHEALRSRFVLEVQTLPLDSRFCPLSAGIIGFEYRRIRTDEDDFDGCSPRIALSAAEGTKLVLPLIFADS